MISPNIQALLTFAAYCSYTFETVGVDFTDQL